MTSWVAIPPVLAGRPEELRCHTREEIEACVAHYLEVRERMDRNEGGWEDMAALFTDDATYIDPAWGRIDGIEAIRTFLRESMAGLDDWQFPIEWVAIDGDNVVVKWLQRLPGQRADGSHYDNSGVSLLTYAGGGRFSRGEDHLNMLHVYEVIAESGWRPGARLLEPAGAPSPPLVRRSRRVSTSGPHVGPPIDAATSAPGPEGGPNQAHTCRPHAPAFHARARGAGGNRTPASAGLARPWSQRFRAAGSGRWELPRELPHSVCTEASARR